MTANDPEPPVAFLHTGHSAGIETTDRIINSPARRSPVLEAVLSGAGRSYVNLAPPSHPSTGRIGASLVVNNSRPESPLPARAPPLQGFDKCAESVGTPESDERNRKGGCHDEPAIENARAGRCGAADRDYLFPRRVYPQCIAMFADLPGDVVSNVHWYLSL